MNYTLVTGAGGFIGFNVCKSLLESGNKVIGIDCYLPDLYSASTKKDRIRKLSNSYKESFIFLDLDLRTSELSVLEDYQITDVINEAAMPGLSSNWANFYPYYSCNLEGLHRLVEQVKNFPLRSFVHASTSSVYGKNALGDEREPLKPTSPYGVSKVAAENLLLAYGAAFNLPVKILRYFSVYGPHQRPDMAFSKIVNALRREGEFQLFGEGTQARSNTYIDDIVDATLLATKFEMNGEIFNICGEETTSLLEIIRTLEEISGRKLRISKGAPRIGDQQLTSGNNVKAKEKLGWSPKTSLKVGLERQYNAADEEV